MSVQICPQCGESNIHDKEINWECQECGLVWPKNASLSQKIADIIDKLPKHRCNSECRPPVHAIKESLPASQEILDIVLSEVLESVIGADVEVPRPTDDENRCRFYRRSGQNFLKHQQRAALSKLRTK